MSSPDIFQQRALRTWHTEQMPIRERRNHAILGLVGEAGELAELHKKDEYKPNHGSTALQRMDELGDLFYYVCILAHLDGFTIEQLSAMNARKLEGGHGWQPDYVKGR
jgi:NTP pyrophosphatase (non-canonical NTP hydrolase)